MNTELYPQSAWERLRQLVRARGVAFCAKAARVDHARLSCWSRNVRHPSHGTPIRLKEDQLARLAEAVGRRILLLRTEAFPKKTKEGRSGEQADVS